MLLFIICILFFRRCFQPSMYNAISVATNNFSNRNIIGNGNSSTVYTGIFANSERAFKLFNNPISFQHEINIFHVLLPHPNIINLIDNYTKNNHNILILEYMIEGNLNNYIERQIPINEREILRRLKISLDISEGIRHMHHNDILHKDINASNVLLDSEYNAKICDFELSRNINHQDNQFFQRGHIGYFEFNNYIPYTRTQDIYRLGVIFIELITNTHANAHHREQRELPNYVLHDVNIQQGWPQTFLNIAEQCCTHVDNRPNAEFLTENIQNIINNMNQNANIN